MDDRLMTSRQVAELLGATEGYLAQLRFRRRGPTFVKRDGLVRYHKSDVNRWLEAGRVTTKDQQPA